MSEPMTEAERAVAEVIDSAVFDSEMTLVNDGAREDIARAVVAAVRPLIEADALEALADGAAAYGPPTADQLRGIAFMVRKGLKPVRDWLDADESLRTTTSEKES
jgi:hypothetical protein